MLAAALRTDSEAKTSLQTTETAEVITELTNSLCVSQMTTKILEQTATAWQQRLRIISFAYITSQLDLILLIGSRQNFRFYCLDLTA